MVAVGHADLVAPVHQAFEQPALPARLAAEAEGEIATGCAIGNRLAKGGQRLAVQLGIGVQEPEDVVLGQRGALAQLYASARLGRQPECLVVATQHAAALAAGGIDDDDLQELAIVLLGQLQLAEQALEAGFVVKAGDDHADRGGGGHGWSPPPVAKVCSRRRRAGRGSSASSRRA
ncbi:hypothetical protein D3C80_530400 [compost metagenome]